LDLVPGAAALRETKIWRRLRHRMSLWVDPRTNSHFTGFLRLPTQFDVLVGTVMSKLASRRPGAPLSVAVLGCSNGAEAFTIASAIVRHHPEVAFRIQGYDIDGAIIEKARSASYTADEIYNNKIITEDFVDFTFEPSSGEYRVKPSVAERARFAVGDVLDPRLAEQTGPCDVVFAQNFLFHLKRPMARAALDNIVRLMQSGSFLFVDGVDLDLRTAAVRKHGLMPVLDGIQQIHEEARRARAIGWPNEYWGLEPFLTTRRDWQTRYATIFVKP